MYLSSLRITANITLKNQTYSGNKKARHQPCFNMMVGTERLELSHLAALEPKSSASTNFATSPSGYQLSAGFLSNFGRGSRIRTLTNGFGDRHATITPILYFNPIFSYPNIDWWGRRDSNSHTSRRWNLNPVRLPISPRPQWLCILQRSFPADKPFIRKKHSFD